MGCTNRRRESSGCPLPGAILPAWPPRTCEMGRVGWPSRDSPATEHSGPGDAWFADDRKARWRSGQPRRWFQKRRRGHGAATSWMWGEGVRGSARRILANQPGRTWRTKDIIASPGMPGTNPGQQKRPLTGARVCELRKRCRAFHDQRHAARRCSFSKTLIRSSSRAYSCSAWRIRLLTWNSSRRSVTRVASRPPSAEHSWTIAIVELLEASFLGSPLPLCIELP